MESRKKTSKKIASAGNRTGALAGAWNSSEWTSGRWKTCQIISRDLIILRTKILLVSLESLFQIKLGLFSVILSKNGRFGRFSLCSDRFWAWETKASQFWRRVTTCRSSRDFLKFIKSLIFDQIRHSKDQNITEFHDLFNGMEKKDIEKKILPRPGIEPVPLRDKLRLQKGHWPQTFHVS